MPYASHCYQLNRFLQGYGASVIMAEFSSEFPALQESILLKSYHSGVGGLCDCPQGPALFRCAGQEYCFGAKLFCQACILLRHKWLPFHRTEQWNGKSFVDCSLEKMGYILGHNGEKCPNLSETTPPRRRSSCILMASMTCLYTSVTARGL